jgi:hypothetical protein
MGLNMTDHISKATRSQLDARAALKFLEGVWVVDAKYHCLSIKERDGPWHDVFFRRSEWRDIPDWVSENAASNLYFCPHAFDVRRRLSECAVDSAMLWADLDAVAPQTLAHRPTVAWRSSRGRYAGLWMLDREPTRGLRKGFNQHIGADVGWNFTKVLRLPGTLNWKYEPPHRVLRLWDDGPEYKVDDLMQYEVAAPEADVVPVRIEGIDGRAVCKRLGCWQLLSAIEDKVPQGRRSSVIWKLGMTLKEKGATRDEVGAVIYQSWAWQSKHGASSGEALEKEIARVFAG